ncbi:MAG: DUF4126 domain-containing protein [Candidatus Scalindua sp. AMX11]|nr:MAG: DUF4126 domain-containing protein [Candidatus Scalindua sp.]NOG84052.1 DUF4126 domain-containing protein [Planctomycetota bacterium]RZV67445.1 MAG: DUF4126 domain-containing protein [Candidatus Scalindua sp. SCAELEC01]TDE63673.1 MAG: DUF4126 domain-containing protein [Candidatus Scalindua sp. AMX11]GJQ60568.1 MAG: hypothetical protein SCALA701_33690 [Candidatus Scalindua sp.]
MEIISSIGILLGSSWASGVNLYLSMAGLGIAHRMEWIKLPGDLEIISHPAILGVAIFLFVVEFIADKIPYVDSLWDSFHTFIRPLAGAAIGYSAMSDSSQVMQIVVALLTGGIALDSHLTKATSRLAINASPEPVSNSVASLTEDATVIGALYLILYHPVVIAILVTLFIILSVWFLRKMYRFLRRVFSFSDKGKPRETNLLTQKG